MMKRIEGIIGGIIAGIIIVVIARTVLGLGITILPLDQLIWQLAPGILFGGVVGGIFPKVFACFSFFLPTD
jgi:hypothetical protein